MQLRSWDPILSISLAVTVTSNLMVPCLSPLLIVEQHMQANGPKSCFNNPFLKSGSGFVLCRFSARKKNSSPYLLRTFCLCLTHQKGSFRHRSDDHKSLFSKSVWNYILEMLRKWYKFDPRLCFLCILYALNTVVVWHYLEKKKIGIVCPSISDAESIWSVLRQKAYGLIKRLDATHELRAQRSFQWLCCIAANDSRDWR